MVARRHEGKGDAVQGSRERRRSEERAGVEG